MRKLRERVPDNHVGLYHVVNRVVDRRKVFGPEEKQRFLELTRACAGFSGLQVVAWCLMDNHFHLLLRVPAHAKKDSASLPEEEALRRIQLLYGAKHVSEVRRILAGCPNLEARQAYLRRFTCRMGDLSLCMKSLKQRFTQWFNHRNQRQGTLWEERFRSVVVNPEGSEDGSLGPMARVVAAYIDLNPVRAGLVEAPEKYPWCGWARAVTGDEESLSGIRMLMGARLGFAEATSAYQRVLAGEMTRRPAEVQAIWPGPSKIRQKSPAVASH